MVDLADARDAAEGTDYRVIDNHHRTDTDTDDKAIGYSAFTPDGLALGWVPYDGQLMLIHPPTLDRDPLPGPPVRPDSVTTPIHAGTDKIVFLNENWDASLTYDRHTRRWAHHTWAGLPRGSAAVQFAVGSNNRLYLGLYAAEPGGPPAGTHHLWSVDLYNPLDTRDEHQQVGSIAQVGGSLAFTDPTAERSPYLYLRDLSTGQTRTVDTGASRTDEVTVVPSGNHDFILTQIKSDHGDRVTAYSTDRTRAVTVTSSDRVFAGGINNAHVLVYGRTATYTAELDTGRLLKVSDQTNYGAALLSRNYVFWHEPTPDTSVIQVVAEML